MVYAFAAVHALCGLMAQVGMAQETAPLTPKLREIRIPADRVAEWLRDHPWQPVSSIEYAAIRRAVEQRRPHPPEAWIEESDYTATFEDGILRNGTWTATVAMRTPGPVLVPLESMALTISRLGWHDRDAAWGAGPDGRQWLLAQKPSEKLVAQWQLAGRRMARGAEFDLRIARSMASRLMLRVPSGFSVSASVGDVRGPQPADKPGWNLWLVDLGSRSRCRLVVNRSDSPGESVTPVLMTQVDTTWLLRDDNLRVRTVFDVEALEAPVSSLEFSVPTELQIFRVTLGGEPTLPWKTESDGAGTTVRVQFLEPVRGRIRPIRLEGVAPVRLEDFMTLPQVRLKNAVLLEGQATLQVDPSLNLRETNVEGCVQTATSADKKEGQTLVWRQDASDAKVSIDAGPPRGRFTTSVLTEISSAGDLWTARSLIEWRAQTGQTASVQCAIAAGWEVREVRTASGDVIPGSTWDVQPSADGTVLTIEFQELLAENASRRIDLTLRRVAEAAQVRWPLPVVQPLDADVGSNRLALSRNEPATVIGLNARMDGRSLSGSIPSYAAGTFLAEQIKAGGEYRFFRLPRRAASTQPFLEISRQGRTLAVDSWVTVGVRDHRLVHDIRMHLTGDPALPSHLLVYLTGSADESDPLWMLLDPNGTRLIARKLPPAQHADWKLPEEGELWEIELPADLPRSCQIVASGLRSPERDSTVRLAFSPGATKFRGGVSMNESLEQNGRPRAAGPTPMSTVLQAELRALVGLDEPGSEAAWRYGEVTDRLTCPAAIAPADVGRSPTATLELNSILSGGSAATDLHEAIYRLSNWSAGESLSFALPVEAALISVDVNGQGVIPARIDGRLSIELPSESQNTVALRYSMPSRLLPLRGRVPAAVPSCSCDVVDFAWTGALAPGMRSLGASPDLDVRGRLPRFSWRERLFGVLGRPSSDTVLNPFSLRTWTSSPHLPRDLSLAAPSSASSDGNVAGAFRTGGTVPSGWTVFRCTSPRVPEAGWVELGNARRAWILSWVGLLTFCLGGLLMRWKKLRPRGWIAGLAISICAASLISLPDPDAVVVGGCFMGALIAMIFPRRLLSSWNHSQVPPPDVPMGSTATYLHGAVVSSAVLIALALLPEDVLSQEGASSAAPEAAETMEVLVPFSLAPGESPAEALKAAAPVVYLSPELVAWNRSRSGSPDELPQYLVPAAEFDVRVDKQQAVTISVRFEIWRLNPSASIELFLPLKNANLAGNSPCLVDGRPQAILPAADGRGYRVTLSANGAPNSVSTDTTHASAEPLQAVKSELVLRLNPASVVGEEGIHRVDMMVPQAAAALVRATHETPTASFLISGIDRSEVSETNAAVFEMTGPGASSGDGINLQFGWALQEQPRTPSASVSVEASHLVEIAPSWMQIQTRLLWHVHLGSLDFVECSLPPGCIVQKAVSNIGSAWSQKPSSDGASRLLIEFATPLLEREHAVVDVSMLLPTSAAPPEFVVPKFQLFPASMPHSACNVVYEQVGLVPRGDYRVALRGPLPETLRSLSPDDFQTAVYGTESVRRPDLCWQASLPTAIPIELTPVAPTRRVRLSHEGQIAPDEIQWTMNAEVTVSAAPAFRHRLMVDPRLVIDRITVTEDQADRLVRWTRRGNTVELLLSDKTLGTQDITLSGRLPWNLGTSVALPIGAVEHAEILDSRLTLSHDPGLSVDWESGAQLVPVTGEADSSLAGVNGILGTFRLSPDVAEPPVFRITSSGERPHAQSVTWIGSDSARRMRIEARLRIGGLKATPAAFKLIIPAWADSGRALQSIDGATVHSERQTDGTVHAMLRPTDDRDEFLLRLDSLPDLVEPGARTWDLPSIETPGLIRTGDLLVVAGDSRWRPAGSGPHAISSASIPEWAGKLSERGWSAETFEGIAPPAVRLVRTPAAAAGSGTISFIETQLSLTSDGMLLGRTEFAVEAGASDTIPLPLSEGTRIRQLSVDGQDVAVASDSSRPLEIPLPSTDGPHLIVCQWMRSGGDAPGIYSRPALELVEPALPVQGVHHIAILLRSTCRGGVRSPLKPSSRLDHALGMVSCWVEAAEGQTAPDIRVPLLRERLLNSWQLAKRLVREVHIGAKAAHYRSQLQRLDERIARLQPLLGPMPSVSEIDPPPRTGSPDDSPEGTVSASSIGDIAGPMIFVELPSSVAVGESVPVWIANVRAYPWIGAALAFVLLALVSRKLLRWGAVAFVQRHRSVAWLAFGILWWLCLTPSAAGLVLAVAAGWQIFRDRRQNDDSRVLYVQ